MYPYGVRSTDSTSNLLRSASRDAKRARGRIKHEDGERGSRGDTWAGGSFTGCLAPDSPAQAPAHAKYRVCMYVCSPPLKIVNSTEYIFGMYYAHLGASRGGDVSPGMVACMHALFGAHSHYATSPYSVLGATACCLSCGEKRLGNATSYVVVVVVQARAGELLVADEWVKPSNMRRDQRQQRCRY